jgi:cytochrome c556
MIARATLAVGGLVIGLSAVAVAQQDVIKARKDLMNSNGRAYYVTLNRMQRGQEPYDQAKVDAAMTELTRDMPNLAKLVPPESKPTKPAEDFDASPKIWENKADFDSKLAAMIKILDENKGKAKNVDSLKVVYQNLAKGCNDCHETYRVKTR